MRNLKEDYFNPKFSHIYVERAARERPETKRILSRLPAANVIEIGHYKDVFCRKGQNYALQHSAQSLILANRQGNWLYKGADVCQDFGNRHFYYASSVMNCVYDCEYCYLKGMYPSGHLVAFVNLEELFLSVSEHLAEHPMYVCISYDTDLFALEGLLGYVREWVSFAGRNQGLTIEVRTKCANWNVLKEMPVLPNVIYAFTLSPQDVTARQEHGTPSLSQRTRCAARALRAGHAVRLCFDPMLYCADWEAQYDGMLLQAAKDIPFSDLTDVSVGAFRISQDYLKRMRKQEPYSAAAQFPYQNVGGVYRYPRELEQKMLQFMTRRLRSYLPEGSIYVEGAKG